MPIFSIVTPVYNGEKYISDAINSVLSQTFGDFEHIIVDDCSTDRTREIVEGFGDDRIKYYKNEKNGGVSESRNNGVKLSTGKYVAFLDADDYWMPDKLEKQLAVLEKGAVLCCTARKLVNDDKSEVGRVIGVEKSVSFDSLRKHNSIVCSSVALPQKIADEFPMVKNHNVHEDYIAWLEITKKYGSATGINEPLLCYRLTPTGKSRGKITTAKMTFGVHRYFGENVFKSVYFMMCHLLHGLKKYGGKR